VPVHRIGESSEAEASWAGTVSRPKVATTSNQRDRGFIEGTSSTGTSGRHEEERHIQGLNDANWTAKLGARDQNTKRGESNGTVEFATRLEW
jgi:hypothetical protein